MKRLLSLLLVFLTVLSLTGCSSEKKSGVRIGIAAPDVTHGWVAGVAYYAEKYCTEKNISFKVITSSDAAEMAASLSDLAAWNASAIVVYPQWVGMESAVQEIIDSGIPVVSFDIDIDAEGIYKVSGDNYGMGRESAEYIASRAPSGSRIVIMDVPSSGSVGALRKQGFYDYLKSIGYDTANVDELALDSFTRENALKGLSDYLASHPTVDAVFSYDDEVSVGCIQAISESGRSDVRAITGGGGMQEYFKMIADSEYDSLGLASALYSPMMIEDAIDAALSVCAGESVEKNRTIATAIVTKDNVSEYLDSENTVY